jgi:hypothetical protein
MPAAPSHPVPEQHQRNGDDLQRYQKQERELAETRTSLAATQRELRSERREKELQQYGRTYVLNVAEELADSVDLSEPDWAKHKKRIEKYQRRDDPTGPMFPTDVPAADRGAELTEEQTDRAMQYMRTHPDDQDWNHARAFALDPKNANGTAARR